MDGCNQVQILERCFGYLGHRQPGQRRISRGYEEDDDGLNGIHKRAYVFDQEGVSQLWVILEYSIQCVQQLFCDHG